MTLIIKVENPIQDDVVRKTLRDAGVFRWTYAGSNILFDLTISSGDTACIRLYNERLEAGQLGNTSTHRFNIGEEIHDGSLDTQAAIRWSNSVTYKIINAIDSKKEILKWKQEITT